MLNAQTKTLYQYGRHINNIWASVFWSRKDHYIANSIFFCKDFSWCRCLILLDIHTQSRNFINQRLIIINQIKTLKWKTKWFHLTYRFQLKCPFFLFIFAFHKQGEFIGTQHWHIFHLIWQLSDKTTVSKSVWRDIFTMLSVTNLKPTQIYHIL